METLVLLCLKCRLKNELLNSQITLLYVVKLKFGSVRKVHKNSKNRTRHKELRLFHLQNCWDIPITCQKFEDNKNKTN
jgi:hypothetical protein